MRSTRRGRCGRRRLPVPTSFTPVWRSASSQEPGRSDPRRRPPWMAWRAAIPPRRAGQRNPQDKARRSRPEAASARRVDGISMSPPPHQGRTGLGVAGALREKESVGRYLQYGSEYARKSLKYYMIHMLTPSPPGFSAIPQKFDRALRAKRPGPRRRDVPKRSLSKPSRRPPRNSALRPPAPGRGRAPARRDARRASGRRAALRRPPPDAARR